MNIPSFVTCVAIDFAHMNEFRLASQTWRKNRPEIWSNPLLLFADAGSGGEAPGWWVRWAKRVCDHPQISVVGVHDVPGSTQRHRMLSSLVYGPAEYVQSEWFIKIDCDTLCLKAENTWHPNWFVEKDPYNFVTASWGYTKGKEKWARLKAWAATIPQLRDLPEVPGFEDPVKDHIRHGRIISYFFWGRTEFMRELATLAPGPLLPIDSQDTFVWYCAKRLGRKYAAVRLKRYGFHHGARGMEKRVRAILEET